jgi:hypothetical protein
VSWDLREPFRRLFGVVVFGRQYDWLELHVPVRPASVHRLDVDERLEEALVMFDQFLLVVVVVVVVLISL